jgi:hypothetical protein
MRLAVSNRTTHLLATEEDTVSLFSRDGSAWTPVPSPFQEDARAVIAADDTLAVWGGDRLTIFDVSSGNAGQPHLLSTDGEILDVVIGNGHLAVLTDRSLRVYALTATPREAYRFDGIAARNLAIGPGLMTWSRGFAAAPTLIDFARAGSAGFVPIINGLGEPIRP